MKYYVKMYRKQSNGKSEGIYNPCGVDYNVIINLKTLKGVLNRIKKWNIPVDVIKLEIYTFWDVYKDNSYKLVYDLDIPEEEGYYKNIAKYL